MTDAHFGFKLHLEKGTDEISPSRGELNEERKTTLAST